MRPTALMLACLAGPLLAQGQQAPVIDSAWLKSDTAAKTAELHVIAGHTTSFGGLNFNGFREGGLTLTVPVGWKVVLRFANRDPNLPHSVEVIPVAQSLPTGPVPPAFPGAEGAKLAEGHKTGEEEAVTFTAGRAGSYRIFCAVPGHGMAGMWIRLEVSADARRPSLH